MAERDAEVEGDEALARALIAARFPALDSRSLRRVGKGWDNVVWTTGDGGRVSLPAPVARLMTVHRKRRAPITVWATSMGGLDRTLVD